MEKITLKAARVNAGMSQREAAQRLQVNPKTLCFWENGRTFPKQHMIEKICTLYNLSYDAINFRAN